jgi:radical SAM superfamily enzyme YgiQ (UPF0313 family)
MQKILLIGINARYTHTNLALRYLRNLTPTGKYEVKLREFNINQPLLEILSKIVSEKPDVIAFSVYIWNTSIVKLLLPEIQKLLPDCRLILGGPEVSYCATEWLQDHPYIFHIISGPGETAWQYLLQNNLMVKEKIISLAALTVSELPFPYLPSELSELQHRYVYYEASRGCPYKCSYCLSSRSDQKLQYRDLTLVKAELDSFCRHDLKIVKFVDRSFNADPDYARAIWKYLISLATETKFHFEIQPDLLQQQDIAILSSAPEGRFQLEIGIQSIDPAVLKAIGRYSSWPSIKPKISTLTGLNNLPVHVDLIVGLPFEDKTSLQNSFNEVYWLQADHFQLGFLKVLSGTKMAEKRREYGIIHTSVPPYEVLSTNWLNFAEIDHFRQIAQLLEALYNTGHFKVTLQEMIQAFNSPLEFYEVFITWKKNHSFSEITRNWQVNGKLLSFFAADLLADQKDYLLDCLRWDWCRFAASHYYPVFLQNELLQEAKLEGRAVIREKYTSEFPAHHLNRSIFFKTRNRDFAEKYLNKNRVAVFLKGKLKLLLT